MPFFSLIFLGLISGRVLKVPVEGLAWLNMFVTYLAIPALLFTLVARTPLNEPIDWRFSIATTFVSLCVFVTAFGTGLIATYRQATERRFEEATIQGLAGAYGNIGFMAPGLALAALGPEAAIPIALVFCFDNTLFFTLVPLLMAMRASDGLSIWRTLLTIGRRVLLHPFIVATIAAILSASLELKLPSALDQLLTLLANAGAPCALFALGVTLALRPLKRIPSELPLLVAIKLVLHPILAAALLISLGDIDPLWIATAVLMAALPPATTVFVMAQQYNTYVNRASAIVLIGTLASIVTVSSCLYLIKIDVLGLGMSLY